MVEVILAIDDSEVENLDFEKLSKTLVNKTAMVLQANLKRESPVDHGRLQGSWVIFDQDGGKVVKSSTEYAKWVNDGTGEFGEYKTPIKPVKGKYLVFTPNKGKFKGKTIFAQSVRGQKGQHFVEKSIEQTTNRLEELLILSAMEVL